MMLNGWDYLNVPNVYRCCRKKAFVQWRQVWKPKLTERRVTVAYRQVCHQMMEDDFTQSTTSTSVTTLGHPIYTFTCLFNFAQIVIIKTMATSLQHDDCKHHYAHTLAPMKSKLFIIRNCSNPSIFIMQIFTTLAFSRHRWS